MTRLEIILSAILTLSILFNIGIFVYARAAVTRLVRVSEELGDLQIMIDSFTKHLEGVYGLESFYGDQTLQSLLEHAASLGEQMTTFEYIYSLTEEQLESKEDLENENTEKVIDENNEETR